MSATKIELLSEDTINRYTGKALVGRLTKDEQLALCNHVTALEHKLDNWRATFEQPETEEKAPEDA